MVELTFGAIRVSRTDALSAFEQKLGQVVGPSFAASESDTASWKVLSATLSV
jgi:hypothetical protein